MQRLLGISPLYRLCVVEEKIRTYNFQRDEVVDHRLPKHYGGHSANDVVYGLGLESILMAHKEEARGAVLLEAVQLLKDALEENRSRLLPLRGPFRGVFGGESDSKRWWLHAQRASNAQFSLRFLQGGAEISVAA